MTDYDLTGIIGTTATGKTALAARLAYELGGEVISADSRQVYRGMDIGTGKDLDDYTVEGRFVPYHLIDIVNPGEEYNVYRYKKDFNRVYADIKQRGKIPILCGGTGMYVDAVVNGYRLEPVPVNKELREALKDKTQEELAVLLQQKRPLHNTTDTTDRERCLRAIEIAVWEEEHPETPEQNPVKNPILFKIDFPRKEVRARISKRLDERLQNGMIEEVKALLGRGVSSEMLDYYGLEYRYISGYINGRMSYREMHDQLETAIHQFAKRQDTWWRRMEKRGSRIYSIPGELSLEEKMEYVKSWLGGVGLREPQASG